MYVQCISKIKYIILGRQKYFRGIQYISGEKINYLWIISPLGPAYGTVLRY